MNTKLSSYISYVFKAYTYLCILYLHVMMLAMIMSNIIGAKPDWAWFTTIGMSCVLLLSVLIGIVDYYIYSGGNNEEN